ncbi:MAG: Asp-tRNA(Asn)/Glu-tRNA(Gln) amidotransferase subunit GatA [Oscillospiraceae bacterium]|nr:Asp-tRNA(Asn)/Glu-tRNA(Gln) amidotransferase subunit GatA [Oscillospiraceae bacterium]
MQITEMTAVELGKRIRGGELSATEAVEAVYGNYLSIDESIHAYTSFEIDRMRHNAQQVQDRIDRGKSGSVLAGVPIAVKDNICTRGELTTCASKILTGFRPPFDATVINKARAAGMVIAGKLNMDEFAMGSTSETSCYGPVKNPWNTEHVPGGSSGGAAAAVASGEAICALGSDTGGSIRQPASYCGVTGFKPTYGSVSRYGLIAYASSLDQIGPIAKDVLDCAAIMDVISGIDPMDSTSLPQGSGPSFYASMTGDVKEKVIGIPGECFDSAVDPDVLENVENAIREYEKLGAKIKPISLPFIRYAVPTYYIIATAEASSNLSRFDGIKYGFRSEDCDNIDDLIVNSRSEGFGAEVRKRILLGTFVLSSGYYDAYYNKALKMKQMIMDGFDAAFRECDVIICPTAPMTAPKLGSSLDDPMKMYLSDIFTVSVNLAGLPGLSVPCGFDRNGMPVGAQLIGAAGNDRTVLNMGHAFQLATDYHMRKPGGAK